MVQPVKTTRHLRARNCRSILERIHSDGPISAARLAEQCELRPSTISNILKQLREQGCIHYCGFGNSTQQGGKRPLLIELNPEYGVLVGAEVSPRHVRVVLRDFALEPIDQSAVGIDASASVDERTRAVMEMIEELRKKALERPILGIGIGIGHAVSSEFGPHVTRELERRYGCSTHEGEQAGFAACGEWVIEEQWATNDLVFIDVDNENGRPQVGVGLILNGSLYEGSGSGDHRLRLAGKASESGQVDEILRLITGLLDPPLIILRGASGDVSRAGSLSGRPQVTSARFGEFAVAEGGVAVAFDRILENVR